MKIFSLDRLRNIKLIDIFSPKIVRFVWSAILDKKVCLLPDTFIFTDKGEKHIKDINIGDNVLCTKGFQPVIAKQKIIKKKYLKIQLSNGRILKVTPEHKIFNKIIKKYVEANSLNIGDVLISPSSCKQCNTVFVKTDNKNKFCSVECYRLFQKSGNYTTHKYANLNIIKCFQCDKRVHKRNKDAKFCSRNCYLKYHGRFKKYVNCFVCNKDFIIGKSNLNTKFDFCSRDCYLIFKTDNYKYHRELQEHRIVKENISCISCGIIFKGYPNRKFCSRECYVLTSIILQIKDFNCLFCNKIFTDKENKKRKFCSLECSFKYRHSDLCGHWRKRIFERDNYTCKKCFKVGGILNAHHLKLRSLFPDLSFMLDNGITLCLECHKNIHEENFIAFGKIQDRRAIQLLKDKVGVTSLWK